MNAWIWSHIYIRTNGSTNPETVTDYSPNTINSASFHPGGNSSSMLLALTDSNGIVEHRIDTDNGVTATINLLFYLNQNDTINP